MVLHQFEAIERDLSACIASRPDYADRVAALFNNFQAVFTRVPPSFLGELRRREPGVFQLLLERRAALIQKHFRPLIEEGVAKGFIHPGLDAGFIIAFFTHTLPNLFLAEPGRNPELETPGWYRQLALLVLSGLLAPGKTLTGLVRGDSTRPR